MNPLVERY
jgi:translation elongation factor EF-G